MVYTKHASVYSITIKYVVLAIRLYWFSHLVLFVEFFRNSQLYRFASRLRREHRARDTADEYANGENPRGKDAPVSILAKGCPHIHPLASSTLTLR